MIMTSFRPAREARLVVIEMIGLLSYPGYYLGTHRSPSPGAWESGLAARSAARSSGHTYPNSDAAGSRADMRAPRRTQEGTEVLR